MDSKNGKAPFVEKFGLKRNASYVVVLKLDKGKTSTYQGKKWHPLQEVGRLTNPKRPETIRNFAALFLEEEK